LYGSRPDVVHQKTRPPQWRQIQSRWRWTHAAFFWAGPPSYLLSRVWPVLLFNMALAAAVCVDHVMRAAAPLAPAGGTAAPTGYLPNLSDNVITSLTPMTRYLLFAAAMVLTLRLGRAYERWWAARQAFSSVGSAATALCQRLCLWAPEDDGDEGARNEDGDGNGGKDGKEGAREGPGAAMRRWAVCWHYSILHVCRSASALHPDAAALLSEEELAVYSGARKGRQICVDRLLQIISDADLEEKKFQAIEQILQRGVAAAGVCTGVRFQSMPYAITLVSTGFTELFLVTCVLLLVQTSSLTDAKETLGDTLFTVTAVLALYFGVNLLFLGADEVANQLEDPFPFLPLEDIAATTLRDAARVPAEMRALRAAEAAGNARRRRRRGSAGGREGNGFRDGGGALVAVAGGRESNA